MALASSTMTSPAVGAVPTTLDLDPIITSWAIERLNGGVIEKIDASDVKVTQMSVAYQGNQVRLSKFVYFILLIHKLVRSK